MAVQEGDQAAADELYSALQSVRTVFPAGGHICLSVDRASGLLAEMMAIPAAAADHYAAAGEFCRKAGYDPELAWVLFNYGDLVLRRSAPGDREAANAMLGEALALSHNLGMRPLLERILARRELLTA